jgi:hypothetical protein
MPPIRFLGQLGDSAVLGCAVLGQAVLVLFRRLFNERRCRRRRERQTDYLENLGFIHIDSHGHVIHNPQSTVQHVSMSSPTSLLDHVGDSLPEDCDTGR